jgi:hypothetical protein
MTETITQTMITNELGEFVVNGNTWNCSLAKEASSAISSLDWDGDVMEITFRNGTNPYVYTATINAVSELEETVRVVLSGAANVVGNSSASASVGTVYNQLLKSGQLVLVN